MRPRSTCTRVMGREEYGEGKELLMILSIPPHQWSMVVGSVMAWACRLPVELVLLYYDDVTADKSSRMNSEVFGQYYLLIFSQMLQNSLDGAHSADGQWPKAYCKSNQRVLKGKKWTVMQWPSQSPDLNPIEHAFHLLKTKLKGKCPRTSRNWRRFAVEAWQSITRDETQRLVMSMRSRLQAVIDCKGFANQVVKSESFDYDYNSVPLLLVP